MKLLAVTYKGPEMDDHATFNAVPESLKVFLRQVNGIIAFKGGLHMRGCCVSPSWHSINEVWTGKHAFWKYYPDVLDIDVPFAQDCLGDQYLLRADKVIRLSTESGDVESLDLSLTGFFDEMEKDPVTFLGMQPLVQMEMQGESLEPGHLINVYPPLSLNQPGEVLLKPQPVFERLENLVKIYRQLKALKEGDDFQFIVE